MHVFRSIDTWLDGICRSFCDEHDWTVVAFEPTKRSIFFKEGDGTAAAGTSACDGDDDDEAGYTGGSDDEAEGDVATTC
jgi:hypothetical protein